VPPKSRIHGDLTEQEVLELLAAKPSPTEARRLVGRLREVGTDASVPALRNRALTTPDPIDRIRAVKALQRRATTAAKDALIAILDSRDPKTVALAAGALGKLGARQALPPLIAHLETPKAHQHADSDTRGMLVFALSRMPHPRAVPVLAAHLNDPSRLTRRSAAIALSRIAEPEARSALESAVANMSRWRGRYARSALNRRT
jgi:HEAT repeat protein